jgi:hypothetical protein
MTIKAKRISLIIGILTGLTVLTLLFARNKVLGNNDRSGQVHQSFLHAVTDEYASWIFNQTIKF